MGHLSLADLRVVDDPYPAILQRMAGLGPSMAVEFNNKGVLMGHDDKDEVISRLRGKLIDKDKRLQELSDLHAGVCAGFNALNSDNGLLEERIDEMKTTNRRLEDVIETLKADDVMGIIDIVCMLRQKLKAANQVIKRFEKEYVALEDKGDRWLDEIEGFEKEIAGLNRDNRISGLIAVGLQEEIADLNREIGRLKKDANLKTPILKRKMTKVERGIRTRAALQKLISAGFTQEEIAEALETVGSRTVYRWLRGDTCPTSSAYVDDLESLVREYAS